MWLHSWFQIDLIMTFWQKKSSYYLPVPALLKKKKKKNPAQNDWFEDVVMGLPALTQGR